MLRGRAEGGGIGCYEVGPKVCTANLGRQAHDYPTSFSPITPATIRPMQARRDHDALSPNNAMPAMVTPSAPIPVQIA